MMETTYLFFLITSLYFLTVFLNKQEKSSYLLMSAVCFGFSLLTHLVVLLWLPFIFGIVILKERKVFVTVLVTFTISLLVFSLVNSYLISLSLKKDIISSFVILFSSKIREHVTLPINFNGFLIFIRNLFIPHLRNYTNIIMLVSFFGLYRLYRENKNLFILAIFWIVPSFVTNQWWDSLLFGRHSLLAGFGIAFAASYFLTDRRTLLLIIIIYLATVTVPPLFLLKGTIPYLREAQAASVLKPGLFITSHFARPQVEEKFKGRVFFVNEPGYDKKNLPKLIRSFLGKKQPVYISSSALSDPYGLYSGPYLHSLSLSYAHPFEIKEEMKDFKIVKFLEIEKKDNLVLYKLVMGTPSNYPQVPNLSTHYRRLDYYDPVSRLVLYLKKQR